MNKKGAEDSLCKTPTRNVLKRQILIHFIKERVFNMCPKSPRQIPNFDYAIDNVLVVLFLLMFMLYIDRIYVRQDTTQMLRGAHSTRVLGETYKFILTSSRHTTRS